MHETPTDMSSDSSCIQARLVTPAVALWLAVLCAVLFVLWFETRLTVIGGQNFIINGDRACKDAQVWIDSKLSGTMTSSPDLAMGATVFRARLPDGNHTIDLRKPGLPVIRRTVVIHKVGYLGLRMAPQSEHVQP